MMKIKLPSTVYATICAAALLALPGITGAAPCVERDYAQLKDEAKSPTGRLGLQAAYCIAESGRVANTKLAAMYQGPTRYETEAAQCEAQKTKIMGALQEAKDFKGAQYALGGCKGPMPAP